MAHFARLISLSLSSLSLSLLLLTAVFLLTHCGNSSAMGNGSGSTSGSSGSGGSVSGGGSGSPGPGSSGGESIPGFGAGTGAAGETSAAKFLYANPAPNSGPAPLTIQAGGTLSALIGSPSGPFSPGNDQLPQTMAIDPSGSFLFQTAQSQGPNGTPGPAGVFVYRINRSNGGLSAIGSSLSGQLMYADVVDNQGMFVYAFGSSGVSAFRIQSGTGALTPVPGSPFRAGSGRSMVPPAALMAVDQTNRFLYVSTTTGIFAYTINQTTGVLTTIAGSPFGGSVKNPWAIVIAPTNSYLYEVDELDPSKIFGYSIDQAAGAITPLAGSPFSAGTCSLMPNASSVAGPQPDNMTIPSSGKFMYDNCGVYSIDESTGAIAQVATGGPGDWPVADPTGDFVWAITGDTPACFHCDIGVAAFQIDPNTGELAEVPNSLVLLTNSEVGGVTSLAITK